MHVTIPAIWPRHAAVLTAALTFAAIAAAQSVAPAPPTSLNYFETRQIVTDTAIRGSKVNWINAIWSALDPARRVDSNFSDIKEQNTDGLELELVGNPTKNVRFMANVSLEISR